MGLFRKRDEIVDLTETVIPIRKKTEKQGITTAQLKKTLKEKSQSVASPSSVLDFMSGQSQSISNISVEQEEKIDLPDVQIMLKNASQRIEDHSHELYRLLHRMELLEKKIERLENRGII